MDHDELVMGLTRQARAWLYLTMIFVGPVVAATAIAVNGVVQDVLIGIGAGVTAATGFLARTAVRSDALREGGFVRDETPDDA